MFNFQLCEDGFKGLLGDSQYLLEIKYDGCRLAYSQGKLFNRDRYGEGSKDYSLLFPEILQELDGLSAELDGELIVLDGDLYALNSEIALRKRMVKSPLTRKALLSNPNRRVIEYRVFDILSLCGVSLKNKPLQERKQILGQVVKEGKVVKLVEGFENTKQNFDLIKEQGEEGVILKKKEGVYCENRNVNFLKLKFWKYKKMRFNSYERHNKGVKLLGECEVNVNGRLEADRISEAIDRFKEVDLVVRYSQLLDGGKLREPSYKEEYKMEVEDG
jgi:ATP-dependent DNA ligase